jgi:Flp pilus assembly protein TadG
MIRKIENFWRQREGSAAMEAAMFFPILMTMIFGVFDLGHAITSNHKMITGTQVIADLVARNSTISSSSIDQAIDAGALAMLPYAKTANDFGIDIVSVKFDDNANPTVIWRETRNMDPDDTAVGKSKGLGTSGEGAMVVTMVYDYKTTFGNIVIPSYRMRETAFSRGRHSSVVTKN